MRQVSRRAALKTVGVAGIAGLSSMSGCIGGFFGGKSRVERIKEKARSATEKYRKENGGYQAALEDGYSSVLGPTVPRMGWHFVNDKIVKKSAEEGLKVEEPPLLLYNADGKLGGTEYGGPAALMSQSPDFLSDVEEAEFGVHKKATHLFATPDESVKPLPKQSFENIWNSDHWVETGKVIKDLSAGDKVTDWDFTGDGEPDTRVLDGVATHPDLISVHIWAWVENPNGTFAQFNPNFETSK